MGVAKRKSEATMMFKGWLAMLQHLAERREEKREAEAARKSYREKAYADKPILVNAILDKILPDEESQGEAIYFIDQRSSLGQTISDYNVRSSEAQFPSNPFRSHHQTGHS